MSPKITLPESRKVGHLTLLRDSREISPKEFNQLNSKERLDIVRSVPGRAKYDLLIEAADAQQLVQSLAPQEVYALIRDVGEDDVADLVGMVSIDQLATFIDLDAWRTGDYNGKDALHWLTLLGESGEQRLWEAFNGLDWVLLALLFSQFITVTGGLGDLLDEDRLQKGDIDRIYQVDFKDSELAKQIGGYLDIIYRRDREGYIGLLEMIRTEAGAELEELGFQQRNGRLLDQGIPDPEGALSVYAFIEPTKFTDEVHVGKVSLYDRVATPVPGNVLVVAAPGGVLAELFSGGVDEDLAWELTCLTNKLVVASQTDFGDPEQLAGAMSEVYSRLELALGFLCGNDLEASQQALGDYYLEHLFRLGHSLVSKLQKKATVLHDEVGRWLDTPYLRVVEGLTAMRPQVYKGLLDSRTDGLKDFASYPEVEKVSEVLDDIESQRRLFCDELSFGAATIENLDLNGCNYAQTDITFSGVLLTSLSNRLLGREFSLSPLAADELKILHAMVSQGEGRLNDKLREETLAWLESMAPGSSVFGGYCLRQWEEGFCALRADEIDARFVPGLLVKL